MEFAVAFLGAGIGGMARHGVNLLVTRAAGPRFPWGIAVINVTGSFLMGVLTAWFAFHGAESWTLAARLFATTGVLGGYTTFSAFSLDFGLLWERGERARAVAYVVGSVGLSLIAVCAGLALVRAVA